MGKKGDEVRKCGAHLCLGEVGTALYKLGEPDGAL